MFGVYRAYYVHMRYFLIFPGMALEWDEKTKKVTLSSLFSLMAWSTLHIKNMSMYSSSSWSWSSSTSNPFIEHSLFFLLYAYVKKQRRKKCFRLNIIYIRWQQHHHQPLPPRRLGRIKDIFFVFETKSYKKAAKKRRKNLI